MVTPGRLALHEDALVGLQVKAGTVLGNYDPGGHYLPALAGDTELDLEQDLLAAIRVLGRGQLALLVPLVETRRATPQLGAQFGGGPGDVNASARYDFVLAGEHRYVPGVALLAGVTLPTGRTPESSTPPLLADATGVGAFQINGALAAEQTFGPWLVNVTGLVAKRTEHGGETLGTLVTLLAAGAYTFPSDAAVGLSVAYAFEGDASRGAATVPDSFKSAWTVTASGLWPLGDLWRVLGGVSFNPPVDSFGHNQPAATGLALTGIRAWL